MNGIGDQFKIGFFCTSKQCSSFPTAHNLRIVNCENIPDIIQKEINKKISGGREVEIPKLIAAPPITTEKLNPPLPKAAPAATNNNVPKARIEFNFDDILGIQEEDQPPIKRERQGPIPANPPQPPITAPVTLRTYQRPLLPNFIHGDMVNTDLFTHEEPAVKTRTRLISHKQQKKRLKAGASLLMGMMDEESDEVSRNWELEDQTHDNSKRSPILSENSEPSEQERRPQRGRKNQRAMASKKCPRTAPMQFPRRASKREVHKSEKARHQFLEEGQEEEQLLPVTEQSQVVAVEPQIEAPEEEE